MCGVCVHDSFRRRVEIEDTHLIYYDLILLLHIIVIQFDNKIEKSYSITKNKKNNNKQIMWNVIAN